MEQLVPLSALFCSGSVDQPFKGEETARLLEKPFSRNICDVEGITSANVQYAPATIPSNYDLSCTCHSFNVK